MSRISRETYFESVYADALERISCLEEQLQKTHDKYEETLFLVNTMWPVFRDSAEVAAREYAEQTPELGEYFELGGWCD